MLGHLSLSSTSKEDPILVLPKTFLAPNLRHLTLLGINLPKRLQLLSTVSFVTLVLTNIRASGYFLPRLLVARLQSLPLLEKLTIGFSIPISRPSAERELLGKRLIAALAHIWNALSPKLGPLFWSDSTSRCSINSPLYYHTCPTSSTQQKHSSSPLRLFSLAMKSP
ncbi:hypothetical protein EDB85DRAFT_1949669 [Lactarius pseudohatsudake]|nr:hypothetical protein EDB85DRAFT_1949669 [Lactarius pseudohatsudake]